MKFSKWLPSKVSIFWKTLSDLENTGVDWDVNFSNKNEGPSPDEEFNSKKRLPNSYLLKEVLQSLITGWSVSLMEISFLDGWSPTTFQIILPYELDFPNSRKTLLIGSLANKYLLPSSFAEIKDKSYLIYVKTLVFIKNLNNTDSPLRIFTLVCANALWKTYQMSIKTRFM